MILFFIFMGLVLVFVFLYLLTWRFFRAVYPHNLRGTIPNGSHEELLIPVETGVHVKLRVWGNTDSKDAILFIHGWDSSMGHFHKQIEYFIDKGYLVTAMDMRSHGESSHQKYVTLVNFADDISHVVDYLSTHYRYSKLTCYGHSLGGVSLLVGVGNGIISNERISRLIVEGIYSNGRYVIERFYEGTHLPRIFTPLIIFYIRLIIATLISKDHPFRKEVLQLKLRNPEYILKSIHIPVISIHAVDDYVVNVSEQEKMVRKNPQVIKITLNSGGHFKLSMVPEYFDLLEKVMAETESSDKVFSSVSQNTDNQVG